MRKLLIPGWFIGYYGAEDRGKEVTEDSPPGADFAAQLCQQWEEAAAVEEDIRKVTVRIGKFIKREGYMWVLT